MIINNPWHQVANSSDIPIWFLAFKNQFIEDDIHSLIKDTPYFSNISNKYLNLKSLTLKIEALRDTQTSHPIFHLKSQFY